ncbi:dihydrofolate reductase [Litorivivens lipolytica]|uniref:Dihydrofolate reductase n=1 Tax=Litorivivens lipolytica TaxID=1524264 RepID=A0A7W4Z6K6_9GAMM|nr:dihydrofolate reductase [Litorivivens lipolytica]MBB3048378.1 dihydrofolate reductase [Litorivivens lipolytica]
MSGLRLAMIAAMSRNRVIGRDNALPWHISADLKHFKRTTLGKPVVMGRKTYESIGRPLPGRTNIVVTRQQGYQPDGVRVATSTEAALALAEEVAVTDGAEEVMVIGGEQLYRSLLPHADHLYLTEVDAEVEGDAFFPELESCWVPVSEESGEEAGWRFRFVEYQRRG